MEETKILLAQEKPGTSIWHSKYHTKTFDFLAAQPFPLVKHYYESFNEVKLLKKFEQNISGNQFYEVGCATGELYRYISKYHKRFDYKGFDISADAIERATAKYGLGKFYAVSPDLNEIMQQFKPASVVFARDVIIHQTDPYKFIDQLLNITSEALFLRLRTRDQGNTVLNVQDSCQLYGNDWVPYMVLNLDELIRYLCSKKGISKIVIARHYQILGGTNLRYVSKELYLSETGSAETAIYIQKKDNFSSTTEITYEDSMDGPKYNLFHRLLKKSWQWFHF